MSPLHPTARVAITAALLAAAPAAFADPSYDRARFHWADSVGVGYFAARSRYTDGTRNIGSLSINAVDTTGVRLSRLVGLALETNVHFLPAPSVTEDRSRGHRDLDVPFAIAGSVGPMLLLYPGNLRLDVSVGFFWVLAASAAGSSSGPSFGGYGAGASLGGAYRFPISASIAIAAELRGLAGLHTNADPTHQSGFDIAGTALIGIEQR